VTPEELGVRQALRQLAWAEERVAAAVAHLVVMIGLAARKHRQVEIMAWTGYSREHVRRLERLAGVTSRKGVIK